jgi:hypothetical protein
VESCRSRRSTTDGSETVAAATNFPWRLSNFISILNRHTVHLLHIGPLVEHPAKCQLSLQLAFSFFSTESVQ